MSKKSVKSPKTFNYDKKLNDYISNLEKTKLFPPIIYEIKNNSIYNNTKLNIDNFNFNKSSLSSYTNRLNNTNKSFLSGKSSVDNQLTKNKYRASTSFNIQNFINQYIYNKDKNKFEKKNKNNFHKKPINLQMNSLESPTDESCLCNYNNRSKRDKSNSSSIENYWKAKELKKMLLKMEKMRREQINKENAELRDRPKIDENSRKIAQKLGNNRSFNVFGKFTGLTSISNMITSDRIKKINTCNTCMSSNKEFKIFPKSKIKEKKMKSFNILKIII